MVAVLGIHDLYKAHVGRVGNRKPQLGPFITSLVPCLRCPHQWFVEHASNNLVIENGSLACTGDNKACADAQPRTGATLPHHLGTSPTGFAEASAGNQLQQARSNLGHDIHRQDIYAHELRLKKRQVHTTLSTSPMHPATTGPAWRRSVSRTTTRTVAGVESTTAVVAMGGGRYQKSASNGVWPFLRQIR